MEEKEITAAEEFIKAAAWLKRESEDFTKHFKGSRSIMKVWAELPYDFDRSRGKVANYIQKNKDNYKGRNLARLINAEFGMRYFENAPKWFSLYFDIIKLHSGRFEITCSIHNNWERVKMPERSIIIRDLGNARNAYETLLELHRSRRGDDYEIQLSKRVRDAFKRKPKEDETMEVLHSIPLL